MQTESSIGAGQSAPPPDTSAAISESASAISADSNPETAAQPGAPSNSELSAEDLDAQLDRDMRQESAEQPEEETPAQTQPDTLEAEAPAEAEELDDPFIDDGRPRTREDFDRQWPRIPVAAREEMARIEQQRAAAENIVSEIGGEPGVQFAKDLFPKISNPSPTWSDVDSVMETVEAMNPVLMGAMASRIALGLVEDDTLRPEFANKLYAKDFGEGYDAARLKMLVEYDKIAPLTEEEFKRVQGTSTPTERELELEQRLERAESVVKSVESEKERTARLAKQESIQRGEQFVSEAAMNAVLPDAERFGWTCKEGEENTPLGKAKIRFGEFQTAWMNQTIQKQPEYASVQQLINEGRAFAADGTPTPLFTVNMTPLVNRAKALFREAVRDMQSTFALGLKPKGQPRQQTPGAGTPSTLAKTPTTAQRPPSDAEAALDAAYDAQVKDARTRASMQ